MILASPLCALTAGRSDIAAAATALDAILVPNGDNRPYVVSLKSFVPNPRARTIASAGAVKPKGLEVEPKCLAVAARAR